MASVAEQGLGFDDVLIKTRRAKGITSRQGIEIDISSPLAGRPDDDPIILEVPEVSANMDTVTEWQMAQKIALLGGIGIIHRFMTVGDQVRQVKEVKNRMRVVEEHPPLLPETATIADALRLLDQEKRGYVILHKGIDFNGQFTGLATTRDFMAADSGSQPLVSVMTPFDSLITVEQGTTLEQAVAVMRHSRIQKVPIISPDGLFRGMYTLKDYEYQQKYPRATKDGQGRLRVGAAIGVKDFEKEVERALALDEAGVDAIVVDIAHGGLDAANNMVHQLRVVNGVKAKVIGGNVADAESTADLINSGADAIKVGIGAGFVCTSRVVAKAGVPMITALMECSAVASKEGVPVIGDGGIRVPGDYAAGMAAGSSTYMIGSLYAGTEDSPGKVVILPDGKHTKMVRGMASAGAYTKRQSLEKSDGPLQEEKRAPEPEGRETFTIYRGPGSTEKVFYSLEDGLRSAITYVGGHSIPEMWERTIFIPIKGAEHSRPLGM